MAKTHMWHVAKLKTFCGRRPSNPDKWKLVMVFKYVNCEVCQHQYEQFCYEHLNHPFYRREYRRIQRRKK